MILVDQPIVQYMINSNAYINDTICQIKPATKVLVTGGTGFTGSLLLKKLVESGLVINAIARNTSNISAFKDLNINWFRGEVYDQDLIDRAMEDVEYIFHVAACFREASTSDEFYRNVHVVSTMNLAKRALQNKAFKRFVHVSTIGVHGHIKNPPVTEDSPYNPGDIYQKTKLEAELWLRDFAEKSGLEYCVIRPGAIYGPGDKRLLKFFKMVKLPIFPILGQGKCLYHLIHVEDLVDAFMLSAVSSNAKNQVFLVGANQPTTFVEMAKIIAKSFEKKIIIVRIPVLPFFILADICEFFSKLIGVKPIIYRRRVAFYTKDRSMDTRKIQTLLGFRPKYDNSHGLSMTAEWYISNNWL